MPYQTLTMENAATVAEYLLNLERDAIAEKYQLDLTAWVMSLKQALLQYRSQGPMSLQGFVEYQENIQKVEEVFSSHASLSPLSSLTNLVEQIQAFIPLLTPEAKAELQSYLYQPRDARSRSRPRFQLFNWRAR